MNLLALIWSGIIAFGIIMYVILGGFDLGISMLTVFFKDEKKRDALVSAVLPVWDGNQTWLVFGAAALYGAFPLAFSTILPMLYTPIFLMVIALLFRGVSFEFRLKAVKTKRFWEWCLFAGALVATVSQGLILGAFVKGFSGDFFIWNSFGASCALFLVFGYILLGLDFLIIKTTGEIQEKTYAIASKVQYIILVGMMIASLWSPFLDPAIMARWFDLKNIPYLALLPVAATVLFLLHRRAIQKRQERMPFICAIGLFIACYIGFIISSYPYIVPRILTYDAASSDHSSLLFMLVGACIMLPPLLYYTYYSYKIFRGKITQSIGY